MRAKLLVCVVASGLLSACASIQGVVTENNGGDYQVVNFGGDKKSVIKQANSDAKLTCENEGMTGYVLVSQEIKHDETPKIESGNDFLDAALAIASYQEEKKNDSDFQATTVFKCK